MDPYVELAKKAVESYIKKGETIEIPDDLSKEILVKKFGSFITIEKNGQLRGCIGTYLPTRENVAQETIQNAIAAATEDYRFGAIQKEELNSLSYTVYVLEKPELVKDVKELNPRKYGIIVRTTPVNHSLPKSALLLPGLPGIDTKEKQISIACQKGGIDRVRQKITIYRFKVEKHQ